MHQDIGKRKTALLSTIYPTLDRNKWVNFGPSTTELTRVMFVRPNSTFSEGHISASSYSYQISVVGSRDNAAVFRIVSQYSSLSIPEYSRRNFASLRDNATLSESWKRDMFPGHALHFTFRIKVMKPGLVYS